MQAQQEWLPENRFPGSFQEAVVKLMVRDPNFTRTVQPLLPLEFFSRQEQFAEYVTTSVQLIYDYINHYKHPPAKLAFDNMAANKLVTIQDSWRPHYEQGFRYFGWKFYEEPFVQGEAEYVRDNVFKWVRRRAEMSLLVEAKMALDENKGLEEIHFLDKLKGIIQLGYVGADLGLELFLDKTATWGTIWTPEARAYIPTGKPNLDRVMGGGVGRKELTVVAAAPNTGKSTVMSDFAAGFLQQREPVIYITCEQSALLIMQKIISNLVRVVPEKWHENPLLIWQWIEWFHNNAAALYIKQLPAGRATVAEIEAYVMAVQSRIGKKIHCVLVDYADLLSPKFKQQERRHQLQEIYTDLRALAVDMDLAVVTASQTNRESVDQERVNLDALAEDFGKAGIADIIMFLCQTELEQQSSRARLFFGKNRNRRKYVEVGYNVFYELARLEEDEQHMGVDAAHGRAEQVMNVMDRFIPPRGAVA